MGIQGLLPFLKKASRPANIKEFKGCTVAIDSYCWLHKGAFSCSEKLAMGEKTDQYVFYCLKYINNLLSYGIKPIMVFDGCRLPSKEGVEKQRRERRDIHRKKAAQLLREGRRAEARDCLSKCIDITSHMALELMNACREKGVDCIVAPYEADAQLALLNKLGIAQIIITEDSDLMLFGCERVMFKMDFQGNGVLIEQSKLEKALDWRPDVYTFDKFRYMCILSGCDYLPSLSGIGLGKANKLFKLTRQSDMNIVIRKMATTLNMNNLNVPAEYVTNFDKANNTFLYQLVFDPLERKVVPLTPYPPDLDPAELSYAGPPLSRDLAYQIALGNLDVHTKERLAHFSPETFKPKSKTWNDNDKPLYSYQLSIWDRSYKPMARGLQNQNIANIDRPKTKGKEVMVKYPGKKKTPVKRRREDVEQEEKEDEINLQNEMEDIYGHMDITSEKSAKKHKLASEQTSIFFDDLPNLPNEEQTNSNDLSQHSSPAKQGKENSPMKSPPSGGRNKFAASSQRKKPRFDLNTAKAVEITTEVKSRFFASSKPLPKTSFFKKVFGDEDNKKPKDVKVSVSDQEDEDDLPELEIKHKTESVKEDILVKSEISPTSRSNSPYQTFGFSSKLNKFASSFDKDKNTLQSSQDSKRQFKPVVPAKIDCDKLPSCDLKKNQSYDSLNSQDTNDLDFSESQRSNLYSIDNDSIHFSSQETQLSSQFLSSQESEKILSPPSSSLSPSSLLNSSKSSSAKKRTLTKNKLSSISLASSRNSKISKFYNSKSSCDLIKLANDDKPPIKDLVDITDEGIQTKEPFLPSLGSFEGPSSTPQVDNVKSKLGGCRTSGLSKSSKKKSLDGPGQAKINSFFSKYSFGKKTEKIKSSRESSDDTPTLGTTCPKSGMMVQRKLTMS